MYSRTLLTAAVVLIGCGGGSAGRPPEHVGSKRSVTTAQPDNRQGDRGEIVGEVERIPADPKRKRMVIWGKVQRIIEKKHDELPEAKEVSRGGVGDPVTEIKNGTPFNLTLWFSGKCAHHTKVPPMGSVIAAFCPGTYHIAAVVDNEEYLPLVREGQKFEGGVAYLLQVVVKQRPK